MLMICFQRSGDLAEIVLPFSRNDPMVCPVAVFRGWRGNLPVHKAFVCKPLDDMEKCPVGAGIVEVIRSGSENRYLFRVCIE